MLLPILFSGGTLLLYGGQLEDADILLREPSDNLQSPKPLIKLAVSKHPTSKACRPPLQDNLQCADKRS